MHIDPLLPLLVTVISSLLLLGLLLRAGHQPEMVGYLLAGVVIGPHGLAMISDQAVINHMGSLGVILLLFFIGMEINPDQLVKGWRVAIIGTLLQILFSVALVWLLGRYFGWSMPRIVLFGFVISLSSTAVVLKLLKDRNELHCPAGRNVLMVLLAQDLAVVPMMIILGLLGGARPDQHTIALQLVGGVLIIGLVTWLLMGRTIHLPFAARMREDHELQIFSALLACFGLAFITGMLELSTALGAFVGGMVVAAARENDWVHRSLEPFRTLFMAVFFVSIGLLIDLQFVMQNWLHISLLVSIVILTNTFINTLILRGLRVSWSVSLYAGALLSQIGEFSFVLAAIGLQSGIVSTYAYQSTVAVIAISLLLSTTWIGLIRRLLHHDGYCPAD